MEIAEEVKKLPHWEERMNRLISEFVDRFEVEPEEVSVWKWINEKEWKLIAKYETCDGELVIHEDYGRYF